jgi:hypothetical protein
VLRPRFNLKNDKVFDQYLRIVKIFKIHKTKNLITNIMLRPIQRFNISVFLLLCSLIPQSIFLYHLVSSNVSSGDWYLARQLINIAKIRVETFSLITSADFLDPISLQTLFGNRSYSNGMQILSPDILLYGFLSDSNIFLLHFLFVNTIAIFFIFKIGKLFNFNNLQLIFFGTVWLNCGSLTGRLSEGHIQLLGYNLIPGFFYYVFIIYKNSTWRNYISLGFFLGFIALLGSTHVFFQMCLILLLIGITYRQNLIKLSSTLFIAICSGAPQILPALIFPSFTSNARSVYEGYGYHFIEKFFLIPNYSNTYEIFREFAGIPFHLLVSLTDYRQAIQMNGWEWTLYIGAVNLFLCMLIIMRFRHEIIHLIKGHFYIFIIFILSISIFYRAIFLIFSYFVNIIVVDRVPYRMMIYVFFLTWLFVCYKVKEYTFRYINRITIIFTFFLISYLQLVFAAYAWFKRYKIGNKEYFKIIVNENIDYSYHYLVVSAVSISLLTWFTLLVVRLKHASTRKNY